MAHRFSVRVNAPNLNRSMYFDSEAQARQQARITWGFLRGTSGGVITLYRDGEILEHCNVERANGPVR